MCILVIYYVCFVYHIMWRGYIHSADCIRICFPFSFFSVLLNNSRQMEIYLMFIPSVNFESRYPYLYVSLLQEHILSHVAPVRDIKTISAPKHCSWYE